MAIVLQDPGIDRSGEQGAQFLAQNLLAMGQQAKTQRTNVGQANMEELKAEALKRGVSLKYLLQDPAVAQNAYGSLMGVTGGDRRSAEQMMNSMMGMDSTPDQQVSERIYDHMKQFEDLDTFDKTVKTTVNERVRKEVETGGVNLTPQMLKDLEGEIKEGYVWTPIFEALGMKPEGGTADDPVWGDKGNSVQDAIAEFYIPSGDEKNPTKWQDLKKAGRTNELITAMSHGGALPPELKAYVDVEDTVRETGFMPNELKSEEQLIDDKVNAGINALDAAFDFPQNEEKVPTQNQFDQNKIAEGAGMNRDSAPNLEQAGDYASLDANYFSADPEQQQHRKNALELKAYADSLNLPEPDMTKSIFTTEGKKEFITEVVPKTVESVKKGYISMYEDAVTKANAQGGSAIANTPFARGGGDPLEQAQAMADIEYKQMQTKKIMYDMMNRVNDPRYGALIEQSMKTYSQLTAETPQDLMGRLKSPDDVDQHNALIKSLANNMSQMGYFVDIVPMAKDRWLRQDQEILQIGGLSEAGGANGGMTADDALANL